MIVMAIIALLLVFSAANMTTLNVLDAELELLDQRQQRRITQVVTPGSPLQMSELQSNEEELPDEPN
jgi:hypothetical protein